MITALLLTNLWRQNKHIKGILKGRNLRGGHIFSKFSTLAKLNTREVTSALMLHCMTGCDTVYKSARNSRKSRQKKFLKHVQKSETINALLKFHYNEEEGWTRAIRLYEFKRRQSIVTGDKIILCLVKILRDATTDLEIIVLSFEKLHSS